MPVIDLGDELAGFGEEPNDDGALGPNWIESPREPHRLGTLAELIDRNDFNQPPPDADYCVSRDWLNKILTWPNPYLAPRPMVQLFGFTDIDNDGFEPIGRMGEE